MTGWVTDSTDSVAVTDGDTVDFAANLASPSSIPYSGSFYCVSARFDATTPSAQLIAVVGPSTINPTTAQQFVNFSGVLGTGDQTESNCQFNCLVDGSWKYMACFIESPNNFDTTTTINNRINGNNGSMAISVAGGASGSFEDVGIDSQDTVKAGDKLDYGLIASEAGNGLGFTMAWIGAHFVTTGPCMIGGSEGGTAIIGSDTAYTSLFGGGGGEEASPSIFARATGLFPFALNASYFTNHITFITGSSTFTLLINGSPSLAVTTTSLGTGYITDTDTVGSCPDEWCRSCG